MRNNDIHLLTSCMKSWWHFSQAKFFYLTNRLMVKFIGRTRKTSIAKDNMKESVLIQSEIYRVNYDSLMKYNPSSLFYRPN